MSSYSPMRNRKRVSAPSYDELQRSMSTKRRKVASEVTSETVTVLKEHSDENINQSINRSSSQIFSQSVNRSISQLLNESIDSTMSPFSVQIDDPTTPVQRTSSNQLNRGLSINQSINQIPIRTSPSSWSSYPWALSPLPNHNNHHSVFGSPRFTPPRSPLQRRRSNQLLNQSLNQSMMNSSPSPVLRRSSRSLAPMFNTHDIAPLITPHAQTVFSWDAPTPTNQSYQSINQSINLSIYQSSMFNLTSSSPPPRLDSSNTLPCTMSPMRTTSFSTYLPLGDLEVSQPGMDTMMRSHSQLFPLPKPLTTPRFNQPSSPQSASTHKSSSISARKIGSFSIIGSTPHTGQPIPRLRPLCVTKLHFTDASSSGEPQSIGETITDSSTSSDKPGMTTFVFGPSGLIESTPPSGPSSSRAHLRPYHATQPTQSRFTFPTPTNLDVTSPFRPHSFTFGDVTEAEDNELSIHALPSPRVMFAETPQYFPHSTHQPSSPSKHQHADTSNTAQPIRRKCKCKKSKCLKLYCECFAHGAVCGPECACEGCHNTDQPQHQDDIQKARSATLDRDPNAFYRKKESEKVTTTSTVTSGGETSPDTNTVEQKGCHCKKSKCLKKYCECLNAGMKCTDKCKCEACANGKPHSHDEPAAINSKL